MSFPQFIRILFLLLCLGETSAALAVTVPPGFTDEAAVVGDPSCCSSFLTSTSQIAFAPDGELFIGEKGGRVWRCGNPCTQAGLVEIGAVATESFQERGLNGMAIDPDFATNGHIWIYYTTWDPPPRNRLSRFTLADGALTDESLMIEGPALLATSHNAGALRFASDGTLFVAMGDNVQGSVAAQDPADLRGKILHINRDGTPADDNPFLEGGGDPRVWALGLRNPYRISIQPETDNVFIADVGNSAWEELSSGFPGANFGWAEVEGPQPSGVPGMTYPIYSYSHSGGAAIIGGDFADSGDFSEQYEGNYFFADMVRGEIHRMTLDSNHNPVDVEIFATDVCRPVDLAFGPDGCLYYTAFRLLPDPCSLGEVHRICYVGGGNEQPNAVALVTPDHGLAPLDATLDGSGSSDPEDDPLTFHWDLGDGNGASGAVVAHSYPLGVYEAELTVVDDQNETDVAKVRIVSGNRRPTASVASPISGSNYDAGETITFGGTGDDPEEGRIPCSAFRWWAVFHHGTHIHPVFGPEEGSCSGSFVTANAGETDTDAAYEIFLEVADSGVPIGSEAVLDGEHSIEIFPNISLLTFQTLPLPDLELALDTFPLTPPATVESVVGMIRTIEAVDEQPRAGHTYRWLSWSDGGAIEHEITTPSADTTLTALFGCDVLEQVQDLRLERDPAAGLLDLTWLPLSDPCLSRSSVYRVYAAASPVPLSAPGAFPDDPAFTLVGTSDPASFSYMPGPDHTYFLVVAVGTDTLEGPVGHYDP